MDRIIKRNKDKAALSRNKSGRFLDMRKIMLYIQEEERKRISRDLHDETGQMVIGLGAKLNMIEKHLKEGNINKAMDSLEENRNDIKEITNKMKMMALNLRPPAFDILGLAAVFREYFSFCTKSSSVKIVFNENIRETRLSEHIEITIYRIIQEAMNNVLKYANASEVKVNLTLNQNTLNLHVEDNGVGFDLEKYKEGPRESKLGLRGIEERVNIFNGSLLIDTMPGKGTKVSVTIPLEQ